MLTETQIKGLPTKDLIQLYNHLTGKSITRFSSRHAGEKQVLAAQETSPPIGRIVNPALRKKKSKRPTAKPRLVKGSVSAAGSGRPPASFSVTAGAVGKSKPHKNSLRHQLLEWLKDRQNLTATIEEIESKFSRNMRGVVAKLKDKGWLKRTEAEVGA